jgi:AAA ATPase-like protein
MSSRDEAAFVGREAELAQIEELFVDDPPASVVLVHGPGGIGKSSLLREIARRGRAAGWSPVVVEGRDLPPVQDAIEEALAPAARFERPLVLIDTFERMTALSGYLRREVLPALPEQTVVVIAGRRSPDSGWFEGGWERIVREVELAPLTDAEAVALLAARGLRDEDRAGALAAWAGGSPLALTLAAGDDGWQPGDGGDPREVVRTLVRRLVDAEAEGVHRDALGVACIARVTTAELLRDVLPHVDAAETMRWLESRTFAEPLGGGVTLHELVRRALRADLRHREPERDRELRCRIADSLHARALAGRPILTVDLAELVEIPEIRAFYSWEGSVRNRIDSVRPGDAEQVALLLGAAGHADWWDTTRPFFEQAPEVVDIARDAGDALCAFAVCVTPNGAPPLCEDDPVLGPWLAHARRTAPDGNAIVWRDATDFTRDTASQIQAMINMAGVLRSGLANPRYAYLPIDPAHVEAQGFSSRLGAQHVPELDVTIGEKTLQCHVLDYGPGGLLGAQRDVVYLELGLAPPGADPAPPAAAAAPAPPPAADPETVRQALRSLRLPHELAKSPLASGDTVEERAESVRALLHEAAERAFGETENERLLERVLVRGYLDPAPSHEQAAQELNLSRAAYFRRLKLASERLAQILAG